MIRFQPSSSILTKADYYINDLVPGCVYICDCSSGDVGIELHPISSSNARYEFLISDASSGGIKLYSYVNLSSYNNFGEATIVGSRVGIYYYNSGSAIAYGNLDT